MKKPAKKPAKKPLPKPKNTAKRVASKKVAAPRTTAGVRRLSDEEADSEEGWTRSGKYNEVTGVEVLSTGETKWTWQVIVSVMALVRDEPLESAYRKRIAKALKDVAGVTKVAEEDREVWIVDGKPRGDELVGAVAIVLDDLAPKAKAYIDAL